LNWPFHIIILFNVCFLLPVSGGRTESENTDNAGCKFVTQITFETVP